MESPKFFYLHLLLARLRWALIALLGGEHKHERQWEVHRGTAQFTTGSTVIPKHVPQQGYTSHLDPLVCVWDGLGLNGKQNREPQYTIVCPKQQLFKGSTKPN